MLEFKMWDYEDQKMWFDVDIEDNTLRQLHEPENVKFLQYIGIKDISGNKIYEGDIVEQTYNNGGWTGYALRLITPFHNGFYFKIIDMSYGFVDASVDSVGYWYAGNIDDAVEQYVIAKKADYKIIGNIYENPKLIEKEENGNANEH